MNQFESQEAIIFMGREARILKQMTYMEFEAILDGVVGMQDFADQDLCALYLEVNRYFEIEACVTFTIWFDEEGYADPVWNIPLRKLCYASKKTMTRGKLKTRVVDSTCCPIKSYTAQVWDFDRLGGVEAVLSSVTKALALNTLGLVGSTREMNEDLPLGGDSADHRAQASVDVALMKNEMLLTHRQLNDLQQVSDRKLSESQLQLERLKGHLKSALLKYKLVKKDKNESGAEVDRLIKENQRLSAIIENRIPQLKVKYAEALAEQKKEYEQALLQLQDSQEKLGGLHEKEHSTSLADHAAEIASKEEVNRLLREELCHLRRDKLRLMAEGADQFFAKIEKSGLKMVAYHPGAGHMNIALDDLAEYIEDTDQFLAKACDVSEKTYRTWKAHHDHPVCGFSISDDLLCSEVLVKVMDPKQFTSGVSDRCLKHRSAVSIANMTSVSNVQDSISKKKLI